MTILIYTNPWVYEIIVRQNYIIFEGYRINPLKHLRRKTSQILDLQMSLSQQFNFLNDLPKKTYKYL